MSDGTDRRQVRPRPEPSPREARRSTAVRGDSRPPLSGGLVARNRELAHLDHILWRARAGSASVVVLRGEPGVGKSALIEATIARAADFSVVRLRGAALEDPTHLPKEWPAPVAELVGAPGSNGAPVELACRAVRALFDEAQMPLLISIDDAHLLPEWLPSVIAEALVTQLSDVGVALAIAWRDTPHLPSPKMSIPVPEHRLSGLTSAQAAVLLTQRFGELPSEDVLVSLMNGTGGNPSALIEVCNRLAQEQLQGWRPLPEPLPLGHGLVTAFGERLALLDPDVRTALAVPAAGHLPLGVLQAALEDMGTDIGALRPAQREGVIAVRGERVDFVHPLVRASAFWSLPKEIRLRAQGAVARAYAEAGKIERSAFHAAQQTARRDGTVARLFSQSARIALERAEPAAAAAQEELAADYGPTDDASARHLARAAALWASAGELGRAGVCVERASQMAESERTLAEISYQRARAKMASDLVASVAQDMVDGASHCENESPGEAVLLIVDSLALLALGGTSTAPLELADKALRLARAVSSHIESLAEATRAAIAIIQGGDGAELDRLSGAVRALVGGTQLFPASPQLALVIAEALVQKGLCDNALRFGNWIADCAHGVGDRALSAIPPFIRAAVAIGQSFPEAARDAGAAIELAQRCGQDTIAARALSLLAEAEAGQASYDAVFETAAKLFGLTGEIGRAPRVRTLVMLANVELQRGRASSAFAWLGAAEDDAATWEPPSVGVDQVRASLAPAIAEVMLLGRRRRQSAELVGVVSAANRSGAVPQGWAEWVEAVAADDVDDAGELFSGASEAMTGRPLLQARVELCWGVRLGEHGQLDEAEDHIRAAMTTFEALGAQGFLELAAHEIKMLPAAQRLAHSTQPDDQAMPEEAPAPLAVTSLTPPVEHPPWEITLLGSFSVRRFGEPVALPLSLAAQGLKIVALNEKIPVDELVELLWPDAAPGVGTRRLRNVLWRVRAASGDLLERDGNFIRLAHDAITDVSQFRHLAGQAVRRDSAPEASGRLAREALLLYRGELLPGDRYADWAASYRESFARLHIQLLDLLLEEAVGFGHLQEALALLDRLIEADPFEENHYLRAAELLAGSGNRRRALATIERAERMLEDLGVAPSRELESARDALDARN
ncbi:MAG: BTAD domain-containing putative transcriptional regulator [Acidimicrobiales bacterium]